MPTSVFFENIKQHLSPFGAISRAATSTGISRGTLNKYIAGTSQPSIETAAKLAKYFKISIDELYYGQQPHDLTVLTKLVLLTEKKARNKSPDAKARFISLAYQIYLNAKDQGQGEQQATATIIQLFQESDELDNENAA